MQLLLQNIYQLILEELEKLKKVSYLNQEKEGRSESVTELNIKIKKINQKLPTPFYAYDGDAGCDLYSSIDLIIKPGERAIVPTGIAVSIPQGFAGFVQPRSGLAANHGISIVNTPGLIDSKYRGEIKVVLLNTDLKDSFQINKGDKICQLVFQKVEKANFVVVDDLEKTERGDGGFGSTGV